MADKPHVIGRATALVRAIGDHEPAGASTSDLAREAHVARPTAHRMLTMLAREGFVDRDNATGRWSLGPEIYLLGALAADRYDITGSARAILRELARDTGESAFLSARRGDETVCVASEEGSFPLRSHVLHPGIRFPLGVASAGLVILAHLPDRDIDEYLDRADLTTDHGTAHAAGAVRERITRTRTDGYATNPALLVEGSWGLGAAVFDHRDSPAWALSLTGVETRFSPDRRPELGALLLRAAHQLTRDLRTRHRPASDHHPSS
ncbi:IclR family transcriptional regulator [Nocardia sp. NPDC019395]|uniref:IclR family transcriptional regulator n=1 Tax=Nocardia sp. NPDC019395 TaxID=3154686 RepID=UPI0033D1BACE